MQFGVELVKALRERTGAGVMDCRKALEESQGDLEKAEDLLNQWGVLKAEKRAGAETLEGMVEAYIHSGSRIGALVELNCQTDFVARTPDFKELAHNLAMQVAAMAPEFVDRSDLPEDDHRNPEPHRRWMKSQLFVQAERLVWFDGQRRAGPVVGILSDGDHGVESIVSPSHLQDHQDAMVYASARRGGWFGAG